MAAGETAWLSCRGLAGFASWQPGMPSGEAAWLPAPKLGFASWQGVMASGEARGGPPLGPGPGPVDVGVQESWPTGAGGSMKRRRLSWPWAVGRQCVTRVGSGRVQGCRGSLDSFVQLSALNPQPSTRWRFDSLDSFNSFVPLSPLNSLGVVRLVGTLARGPGEVASVGGGMEGAGGGRRGGARRQPRPAGWLLAARQLAEGDGRTGGRGREAGVASWRGGPLPQVRQEAPGPWPGWASARAWVREGARSEETADPGVGRTHSPTHIP